MNFSSATTPELMLKTFDQYCEYRKTPNGTVLSPIQLNKWLVLFCDEINLPDMDKYGIKLSIMFYGTFQINLDTVSLYEIIKEIISSGLSNTSGFNFMGK